MTYKYKYDIRVSVRLDDKTYKLLEELSEKLGISKSDVIRNSIYIYIVFIRSVEHLSDKNPDSFIKEKKFV